MKKVLMIALIAVAFAACTSNTTNDSAASADTTCVDSCAVDSTVAAPVDTVNAEEVK
jgi:PBP1b-binding outer membrane lipoprotein LpoB